MGMAIEFIKETIISRSTGGNSVQCAAYRSCSKLYDSSIGKTFNYSNKRGLAYSNILIPEANEKYKNREVLWNKIEQIENSHNRKKSAQLAFELTIALPKELSLEHQIVLSESFIKENYVDKFKVIADINIHHDNLDNPHAHVMLTFRSFKDGEFEKAKIRDMTSSVLTGKGKKFVEKGGLNSKWRDYQNGYFKKHGIDLEVDANFIIPTKHEGRIRNEQQHEIKLSNQENKLLSAQIAMTEPEYLINIIEQKYSVFGKKEVQNIVRKNTEILDDRQSAKTAVANVLQHSSLIELGLGKDGRVKYTTKNILKQEELLLDLTTELEGIQTKAIKHKLVDLIIEKNKHVGEFKEQGDAIRHIADSGNLSCVIGRAGAGKTYTMKSIKELYENDGYKVYGTSLSEKATRGLEESSGISSQNIKRLLTKLKHNHPDIPESGSVLIVDEAGMVGLNDMLELLDYSNKHDIKLILVGDPEQLQPVSSGIPFKTISEQIGFCELSNIIRQVDKDDRQASLNLASGKVGLAIDHYDQKGCITLEEAKKAQLAIVKKWRELNQESVIMLAHKNLDVMLLNNLAREYLKKDGLIEDLDYKVNTAKGHILVSQGDQIIFTQKDRELGTYNGLEGVITAIENNQITVQTSDGIIKFDNHLYNQFNLAYATTVHKAQGVTVDHALVYASGVGYDKHLAYVAMSRHKQSLHVYADKDSFKTLDDLKERLSNTPLKDSALNYPYQLGLKFGFDIEVLAKNAVAHIKSVYSRIKDTINYLATFAKQMGEAKFGDHKKRSEAIVIADFADMNLEVNLDYRDFLKKYDDGYNRWYKNGEALEVYQTMDFMNRFFEKNRLASVILKDYNKYEKALKLNGLTKNTLLEYEREYKKSCLVDEFVSGESLYSNVVKAKYLSTKEHGTYLGAKKGFGKVKVYESITLSKNMLDADKLVRQYVDSKKLASKFYKKCTARDCSSPDKIKYISISNKYSKQAEELAYKLEQIEGYRETIDLIYNKKLDHSKINADANNYRKLIMENTSTINNDILNKMIDNAISDIQILQKKTVNEPVLVILGGQPASGKSSAIEYIKSVMQDDCIVINGDEFRHYHPSYNQLLKTNPNQAVSLTQPYTNLVVEKLFDIALKHKNNIIIEGTMRNPHVPIKTAEMGIANGYKVGAYIVTAEKTISRIGCLYRTETEIKMKGCGRYVTLNAHDETYNAIPNTINKLVESNKFINIKLINRDKEILGDMKQTENLSALYETARQKINFNTLYTSYKNIDSVIKSMHDRNASEEDIKEAINLQSLIKERLVTKLKARELILEDQASGKIFSIDNDKNHVIGVIKLIDKKCGAFLETDEFKKSLNRNYNLYSGLDLVKILNRSPNVPKFEVYTSVEWASKNKLGISEALVKKRSSGVRM